MSKAPRVTGAMRMIQAAVRGAMLDTVEHWHGTMMPNHFKTDSASKYGYARRTKKYMIRKARKMGHQRGLEYGGESREKAETNVTFSATRTGGTVIGRAVMKMPEYFPKHPNSGAGYIDKPDELTRTTAAERQELASYLGARFKERMGGRGTAAAVA